MEKTGTIVFYNKERGFGFIKEDETKKDFFINSRSLPTPFDRPFSGDRAKFTVAKKIVGDRATNLVWMNK